MKRICIDRVLPHKLAAPHISPLTFSNPRALAIAPKTSKWPNGSKLSVAFLGGDLAQQAMVREIAPAWAEECNLTLEFKASLPATIRISFNPADGSWSYIGTDNLSIPSPGATMNFGWLDQSVILHEFGHAIGLAHEHQNPEGGIQWNEAEVIRDLSGPPNYWDEATIRHNVLNKYRVDQINGTSFDPDSIMLYSFPPEWTLDGFHSDFNTDLSLVDREFVGSEVMYPEPREPQPAPIEVLQALEGSISSPGAAASFDFTIVTPGDYVIETSGPADVVLALYKNNPQTLIRRNDDGGRGYNARLAVTLMPGNYTAVVNLFNPNRTGTFKFWVVG